MGVLDDMVNALLGKKGATPSATVEPAPGLSQFPTSKDASYARKYGFGYGSGNEAFINNEAARVKGNTGFEMRPVASKDFATYAAIPKFWPKSAEGLPLTDAVSLDERETRNLDLTNPMNKDTRSKLEDTYMKAALTANRIPIAGLGFDPRRMVADTEIEKPALFGAYSPRKDSIYFNTDRSGISPSANGTPVHESIHRGLQMLRDRNPEADAMLKRMPNEESIVRWLMATQAGDPENWDRGNAQREVAKITFKDGYYDKEINALNDMAAKEIAKRKPGGPN